MENDQQTVPSISKAEAVGIISELMNECAVMGANDSEIPTMLRMMEEVRNGSLDPAEAVKMARQIRSSKQDYH